MRDGLWDSKELYPVSVRKDRGVTRQRRRDLPALEVGTTGNRFMKSRKFGINL